MPFPINVVVTLVLCAVFDGFNEAKAKGLLCEATVV